MKGIDTNVLLRLITNDDPVQSPLALKFVVGVEAKGESLYVSLPVLVETVANLGWKRYRYSRADITLALERLLETPVFAIQERDAVQQALGNFRRGGAGFIDHLIGACAAVAGAEKTVTFDSQLRGSEHFTVLK